jgi:peptidoglycan/xylan/chitin deacetylase (PgdA/CDA1 family)
MGNLKKSVKALLGRLIFHLGLHRRLVGNRAVVVAFHRVSDSALPSSINCPPAVFRALCEFFKRHFSVMPLSELLRRLHDNVPIEGALVITFDDGYRDNYEVAAPILRELALPATFFVATDFIDSDTQTFWDRKDGVRSEWMTWSDVEALSAEGFDIGGHTMNHVDLASIDEAAARHEIQGCRQKLTDRLRTTITHFAYPFGGVANINERARRLIQESGFVCCFSCHGGVVVPEDEVFELRREPINSWVQSPYQYGFELIMRAREQG